MSELRITPVQVPLSQAQGVDPALYGAAPAPQMSAPRSYSAPATGGALVTAYLIDMACFVALTALAWWIYPSWIVASIVAVEVWAIATLIRARSGRTPGAFVMQVAAVSTHAASTARGMEMDHAPGLGRQSAHSLIMLLLHATVVGPAVTWAIARDGQTWVDRVCGMGNLDIRASRAGQSEPVFTAQSTAMEQPGVQTPGAASISPAHQWAGPSVSPEAVAQPAPMAPPVVPAQESMPAPSVEAPAAVPSPMVAPPAAPTAAMPVATAPVTPAAPADAIAGQSQPAALPQPQAPAQAVAQPSVQAPAPTQPAAGPNVPPPARHGAASAMPKVPQAPAAQASTPQVAMPQQEASTPSFTQAPSLAIIVDSGQRIEVSAQIVLGRAPEQSPADAQAVAISDSTRSLSRTHLRVAPAGSDALWVEDTFSANGTRLQAPNGTTQPLPRGERVKVPVGTVLLLGERRLSVSR